VAVHLSVEQTFHGALLSAPLHCLAYSRGLLLPAPGGLEEEDLTIDESLEKFLTRGPLAFG
jgi:hypothetical protein